MNSPLLSRALREDDATVALAVRRGARALMPFVTAWEDALSVMSPAQLSHVTTVDVMGLNAGKLIYQLDPFLSDKVLPALPMEVVAVRPADLLDATLLAITVREELPSWTLRQLTLTNESLVRKLSGARDALKHSSDGLSQAANSPIELIDRILRESATSDEVVGWIERELPGVPGLVIDDRAAGRRLPTKKAEVLCFLHGRGPVVHSVPQQDGDSGLLFIYAVLAGVVVCARNQLQQLKHADTSLDIDRARLEQLLTAVEGALLIGLWLRRLAAHMTYESESEPTSA